MARKKLYGRELPFYYGSTESKQYQLFLILRAIRKGTVKQDQLDTIKRHVTKKVQHFDAAEKADIFMAFTANIISTRTYISPQFAFRFIDQRVKNAIRDVKRTKKYVLSDRTEEAADENDPFSPENNQDF